MPFSEHFRGEIIPQCSDYYIFMKSDEIGAKAR